MTDQMKNLIILLCAIAVVLLVVILLFTGKSPFMKFMSIFLEEDNGERSHGNKSSGAVKRSNPSNENNHAHPENVNTSGKSRPQEDNQKRTSEPIVEMATLIRKSDDRLRVVESTGQVKLIDEYYELVFATRKGRTLKIECSRAAYDKVPFNQQGSLTYKRNTLVKFKYYEDTIYNN